MSAGAKGDSTVKSNDAEDEDKGQNENDNRVDLQTRRLIGVKSCRVC